MFITLRQFKIAKFEQKIYIFQKNKNIYADTSSFGIVTYKIDFKRVLSASVVLKLDQNVHEDLEIRNFHKSKVAG